MLGVFLLPRKETRGFTLNLGDYLLLAAAVLRAVMVTLTKRLTEHKVLTTAMLTALQALLFAVLATVVALAEAPLRLPKADEFWGILVYLVLCCTVFAFYSQNDAVRRISPTLVALRMGSEPLFAALFAMLWLHESLRPLQMVGGACILSSVILTALRKR